MTSASSRASARNGLLSGKYRPGTRITGRDDWRSGLDPDEVERKLEAVARIAVEEVPEGVPVARWAVAWPLQDAAVTAVIPGVKALEQLESNISAADLDALPDVHPGGLQRFQLS